MEPCKTIEYAHGIVIKLYQDNSQENPLREFDGQAHVAAWHRRYNLGTEPTFNCREDFETFCREQKAEGNPVYRLPLFLLDHSGLTVNTSGFSCPWDSGQVGYVWTTKHEVETLFGVDQEPDTKQVHDYLRSTVKLLDDHLTGNVYGYVVEDAKGEHLDSCWGFYGDHETSGILDEAKSAALYHVEQAKLKAAEYQTRRAKCFAI